MATLADILRQTGYAQDGKLTAPVTESPMTKALSEHIKTLPQQLATNQAALDSAIGSWNKTDFGTGQPNPNYRPEAIAELTQLMPNLASTIKPLTAKQFEKMYSQHIDIRNRSDKLGEERLKAIQEEGFKQGFGLNTLPVYKGGEPRNIVDKVYSPQKGDYVYLVPNNYAEKISSGAKVKGGWKPQENEVLKIEQDYPSLYEEYLKYFKK
jgi:hypothetical protein